MSVLYFGKDYYHIPDISLTFNGHVRWLVSFNNYRLTSRLVLFLRLCMFQKPTKAILKRELWSIFMIKTDLDVSAAVRVANRNLTTATSHNIYPDYLYACFDTMLS